MWTRLLLVLSMLLLISVSIQASVTAIVDRSRLYQDETLTLTIRADFPAASEALDLTALDTLFNVVSQSQTTQSLYSTAQGQQRWREWQLRIRPREIGTLAIPNFRLGGEQSSPIMITVMDPADRQEGLPQSAVILSVTFADDRLYVGQSTTLTINLDYQVRLQGNFDQLDLSAFTAEKLEEITSQTQHSGQAYRRYQLVYRLTPEQAGTLAIPEIRFVGQYENTTYGQQMRLHRIHPGVDVEVRPIPASYPDDAVWLPAESITLSDNLNSQVRAGVNEHIDWQVTTTILGQPATQLPDPLASLNESDFRLYRNSPEFNDAGSQAQRTDVAALVFADAGDYTLPAVRVPWWDTNADSLRYAELPARKIRVDGISNEAMDILTNPSLLTEGDSPAGGSAESNSPTTVAVPGTSAIWPWISASLGIGWLATLVVFWASNRYLKRRLQEAPSQPAQVSKPALAALDEMALAARTGDLAGYHQALLRWLRTGANMTLNGLRARLADTDRAVLARMEGSLFASHSTTELEVPQTAELLALHQAILTLRPARSDRPTDDVMTLYP
jgi:hypothetical protein